MLYLGWAAAFGAMALFLGLCFRQRVENCLAPAIMLSILVLYLFGLPGLLLPGAFFCAGLGAAAAVGWALIPATRLFGMIGAIPCALLTLLPQLLIGRWTQKKAEKAAQASVKPEKTDEPEREKAEEAAEAEEVWAEAEEELDQTEETAEVHENAAAEEAEAEAAEPTEEEKTNGSFDL